ncbi:NAD(P)H-dependent oxidoreductase [Staphylococcus aureus]|uniref:NAD(P)H-dependent oxidoreductase n=1 Tax=Staphylococcus aureus TaxID=1280 RepID=UPI000DFEB073|nr:NAD(P)H-dependent oxidoreductase [Staphylococcus aureus]SUK19908.1 flavodoxin-like fold domain protein [Staphylococcus aureus]SUK93486.1 flavodoxin-like fold domain protein [Staphylococcus aureus]SUL05071.1 flavodoxin-like fold domain protein [Staphylococcus aureus]SUL06861.1 flavodoxin-like fold domain protein [Staphylococcus aureus]SUL82964.1 flavodoxin-like fold domain protein [Staphylococcus aureus]
MISIIYGGNQSGVCFDLYQSIVQKLNKSNAHIFNLQQMDLPLILDNGYYSEPTKQQKHIINTLNESEILIFIYPLYWFNVPPIMKSFIDQAFWPENAFSFKRKQYFKKGLWKDKKAIILYTQGGPEIFHKLKKRMGYHVLKYPLNLSGIYKISAYHLDNINRSKNTNENNNKKINQLTRKVIKNLEL